VVGFPFWLPANFAGATNKFAVSYGALNGFSCAEFLRTPGGLSFGSPALTPSFFRAHLFGVEGSLRDSLAVARAILSTTSLDLRDYGHKLVAAVQASAFCAFSVFFLENHPKTVPAAATVSCIARLVAEDKLPLAPSRLH
jgi:hypothetical protein